MTTVLTVDDVHVAYPGGAVALDGVSLTVTRGEMIGIVGPSGSGKSTLLNVMGTLTRPSGGNVYVGGVDVTDLDDRKLAALRGRWLGFVFQQFHLIEGITALENVMTGLTYAGFGRKHRRGPAREALARVGLAGRSDHRPRQLSGGEQQRVAIARALVHEPALVLADEPTGALDTANSAELLELLSNLNDEGTTIALITHERELAERLSRRVEVLDGRIVADTNSAEITQVLTR